MKKLLVILCTLFITTAAYAAAWQLSQARTEYSKGQYAQALKTIDSAISSSNYTEAEAYKLRAQIKIKMNNHASAIEDLTTTINEEPTAELYKIRAWANLKVGNYEQALDDTYKIIELDGKGYWKDVFICWQAIVNNNNTPVQVKFDVYSSLSRVEKNVCGNGSIEQTIPAFRGFREYANAGGDVEKLRNQFKVPNTKRDPNRRILIDNSTYPAKEIYADDLSEVPKELSYQDRLSLEMSSGLLEYALGNKELGKKIVNGSISESKTSQNEKVRLTTWAQAIYTGIDSPKFNVTPYINGCSPANIK